MDRSFDKSAKLPVVKIDADRAESLVERLRAEFRGARAPSVKIVVRSRGERLTFASFAELREFDFDTDFVTDFKIDLAGYVDDASWGVMWFEVDSWGARVSASGPTAGWCSFVVEETVLFARRNRVWIPGAKAGRNVWVMFVLLMAASLIFMRPIQHEILASTPLLVGWSFFSITVVALGIFGHRIPAGMLKVRPTHSWIRDHSAELTVGLAAASLLVSVVTTILTCVK